MTNSSSPHILQHEDFYFFKDFPKNAMSFFGFLLGLLAYIPAAQDSLDAYLVLVLTARRENTKHRKPKHKPSIQSDTSEHSSAIVTCLGCNLVVFLLYTLLCCNICPKRPTELLSVNMRKREGTSSCSVVLLQNTTNFLSFHKHAFGCMAVARPASISPSLTVSLKSDSHPEL